MKKLIEEKIDQQIEVSNSIINRLFEEVTVKNRGQKSQDILSHLRNMIEHVISKIYIQNHDFIEYSYSERQKAITWAKKTSNIRYIARLYDYFNMTIGHKSFEEVNSEIIMIKYIPILIKISKLMKIEYDCVIFESIWSYPIDTDEEVKKYYYKISVGLKAVLEERRIEEKYNQRYYIIKKKPIIINRELMYEVTFVDALDNSNKQDRRIAYTDQDILVNYATELWFISKNIKVNGNKLEILYIKKWMVSIRPVEIERFSNVFGKSLKNHTGHAESRSIMSYMTEHTVNLLDIVLGEEEEYLSRKKKILSRHKGNVQHFFDLLDISRDIIMNNLPGANVLRYLLFSINHQIISRQLNSSSNHRLSNLYLKYESIPFDDMPLCSSLSKHNIPFSRLVECIELEGREHEFLARKINNNSENRNQLYTDKDELQSFENPQKLIDRYNNSLYDGGQQQRRRILERSGCYYIQGHEEDVINIIRKLTPYQEAKNSEYKTKYLEWVSSDSFDLDCKEKTLILDDLFIDTSINVIYGAAGTGKSTLISHISDIYRNTEQLFVANTNSAVENLKARIKYDDQCFKTISSVIQGELKYDVEILFIDESSTVSNRDMNRLLKKVEFKKIIIVGDEFQIESITFGNWFSILKKFMISENIHELQFTYRSKDKQLKDFWNSVREMNDEILESMISATESKPIDDSIFIDRKEDEIVLCLNYDGLYGINNINMILQQSNPNPAVKWRLKTYKVGDPILFNDSGRYWPAIYNNTKGKIIAINKIKEGIYFRLDVQREIDEHSAYKAEIKLLESENGSSIIEIFIPDVKTVDENLEEEETVFPFQVSYSMSIHKAQGLEYSSVKLVIANDVEKSVTHNIFYTAITRARVYLKIYWSAETSNKILTRIKPNDFNKDAGILGFAMKNNV